jgi:hypothetical protein
MKRLLFIMALLAMALGSLPAMAADSPINLALFHPIQINQETDAVTAFRFSLIYGVNTGVKGLDLSLVGMNHGRGSGVSWHAVSFVQGEFTGWQNGLVTLTGGRMTGLQTGGLNRAGGGQGVQFGLVNTTDGEFSGLMFGFINIAEQMSSGLQIGLINIIQNKEKLKFFPIVNWRF